MVANIPQSAVIVCECDPASFLKAIKTRRSRASGRDESLIAQGGEVEGKEGRRWRPPCLHLSREKKETETDPPPTPMKNRPRGERREARRRAPSLLPDDFEIRYLIGVEFQRHKVRIRKNRSIRL